MNENKTPTSIGQIFDIVEILDLVGLFLSPPDLLNCCQVSHHWNILLTPRLWETIDDSRHSWSKILEHYDADEGKAAGHDELWARRIFAKYGRHIRNLSLSWRILIDAANDALCSNLRSFHITNVRDKLTRKEKLEKKLEKELANQQAQTNDPWRPAVTGPLLSPEFEGALQPSDVAYRPKDLQERDWITAQNFWILTRRNTRLLSLTLSHGLRELCEVVSDDYIQDVVAGLLELRYLVNSFEFGDPYVLITRLRHLDTLCTAKWSQLEPSSTVGNLKTLTIQERITTRELVVLLRHLPSLESLSVRSLTRLTEEEAATAATIKDSIPSQLRRLFFSGFERASHIGNDSRLADAVLPWMPYLEHIEFYHVIRESAFSILRHCRQLRSIVQTKDHFSLFAKLGKDAGLQYKTFAEFLCDGAHLRILSGPRQVVDVDDIVEHPWTCDHLESFHCQVGRVERLLEKEEDILDRLSSKDHDARLSAEEQEVAQKYAQSVNQHRHVYERLASLTHLTRLDLSYELRTVRLAYEDRHIKSTQSTRDRTLMLDCLELTLKSGLSLLAPLVNLEMFGFLGIDHRIDKPELEWMAASWRRLKTMRGLTDDHEPQSAHDRRKSALRVYMMQLRPDVIHESIIPAHD
ncbi:hypothetical protein KI688_005230 [Linnemannia hyalina]|uniref:F-box domain-containing protein n=1 Tax=Linnemannia hyalina TaxID=64524 RepID=A0A9P7XJP2_9FUNG|nr:hypothetical protein KI688_005230 [Linnemannia hyalina]